MKNHSVKKTQPEITKFAFSRNNPHVEIIEDYLRKLKFRRQIIGGVSEREVWKVLAKLNELYDNALISERKVTERKNDRSFDENEIFRKS